MWKVLFSQVCVCSNLGGTPFPSHNTSTGPMSFLGGTPVTSPRSLPWGVPQSQMGVYTSPRWTRGGVYPSPRQGKYPSPRWEAPKSQAGGYFSPRPSPRSPQPGQGGVSTGHDRMGYTLARTGWGKPWP